MNNNINKKIFICATEQSGDNIGEKILEKLIKKYPMLIIDGVGGAKMKPFMQNQFYSLKDFKSMGIIEILFSIKKYLKIINSLSKYIAKHKYDLIITIDSPDFNYPLSKKIKKYQQDTNIIHFVAPTVWAWRSSRAKKFAKVYNEIFTLFPFENKFFEKHNLKSTCIGHPIYYIKNNSNLVKTKNNVAFLPGSRIGEIKSLFMYYQFAYEQLMKMNSKLQIFIPTLPHLREEIIERTKKWKMDTIIIMDDKKMENYFLKTKIALVCSGTASLEIAKRGIPQLVIYKLNYFTELIARFFIRIKFANILNILENKMIIPEITNSNLKKNIFIKQFDKLLLDEKSNSKQIEEVSRAISKIELLNPPFEIAAQGIKKFL